MFDASSYISLCLFDSISQCNQSILPGMPFTYSSSYCRERFFHLSSSEISHLAIMKCKKRYQYMHARTNAHMCARAHNNNKNNNNNRSHIHTMTFAQVPQSSCTVARFPPRGWDFIAGSHLEAMTPGIHQVSISKGHQIKQLVLKEKLWWECPVVKMLNSYNIATLKIDLLTILLANIVSRTPL